jgi:NADPH-dependent 2,4-dienoyl-CoA reductase/sulfur reductase-like enzyme
MAATMAIIGAGIAGISAAEALRTHGHEGTILLFNAEAELPYDRPPLSKAYALGAVTEADIWLRPPGWYEEQRITHLQGVRVLRIDVASKLLQTQDGAYGYDKLLLATGAQARCPPGLDPAHPNVLVLRTAADARRLRARLQPGTKIILVGGGVIGMECAASAAKAGCRVMVLEGAARIMARLLAPAVADYVTARHRAEGVEIRTGFAVAGIEAGVDRVRVTSAQGEVLQGDLVLVGIGAAPDVALAAAAGLTAGTGGITVDAAGRSSVADIYAVGDCAMFQDDAGQAVRLETWTHAVRHAQLAARNMLGQEVSYTGVPWVWSDQYDMNIQVTGAAAGASLVLRGSMARQKFTALHLDESGALVGAATVNHGRDKRVLEKLIAARVSVPADALADEAVPLKSFLPADAG